MAETQIRVIRKKITAPRLNSDESGPGADRAWRLALARSARDMIKLPLDVVTMTLTQHSLVELLELPSERAMIAVLDGPEQTMGLWVADPAVLAALVEVQTLGRVLTGPAAARRPTRTDAAMVAEFVDAALKGLENGLSDDPDLVWAGGYRYASFLDDPRPLGLLLEDEPYRVLRTEVSLAGGAKSGVILLAVPAAGRGKRPDSTIEAGSGNDPGPAFAADLAERVSGAGSTLEAVLSRLTLPISVLVALRPGEVLPLPLAALDRITLEGIDGRQLSMGKLGQNRGMRAVRMTPEAGQAAATRPGVVLAAPEPRETVLRQTGTG